MLKMEKEKKKNMPVDEFERERLEKTSAINAKAVTYNQEHLD